MEHKVAEATAAETGVQLVDFIRVGDQVIGHANRHTQELRAARGVHLAILYGVARYGAYLARSKSPADREAYIAEMSARYADMMREHFSDPTLK